MVIDPAAKVTLGFSGGRGVSLHMLHDAIILDELSSRRSDFFIAAADSDGSAPRCYSGAVSRDTCTVALTKA